MPFWRLYYHLVWATKDRQPMIEPETETLLFAILREKADALEVPVWALGGWLDHVHIVVSIPPKLAVAEVVRHLKGESAHKLNQQRLAIPFAWQRGYGAVSLGEQRLALAVAYVRGQKEHHQAGTALRVLEYSSQEDEGPLLGGERPGAQAPG
jgi:REP element-mobilizing transposase RayT